MKPILVLYFKGEAQKVWAKWELCLRLSGPYLTLGEIARLKEK